MIKEQFRHLNLEDMDKKTFAEAQYQPSTVLKMYKHIFSAFYRKVSFFVNLFYLYYIYDFNHCFLFRVFLLHRKTFAVNKGHFKLTGRDYLMKLLLYALI